MNKSIPPEPLDNWEPGVSRRDFLKFCSMVAAAIGLGPGLGSKVAAALTSSNRPPVLWLHFAECTGCSEAVLRTQGTTALLQYLDTVAIQKTKDPVADWAFQPYFDNVNLNSASLDYFDDVILNTVSLDYHETLMAGAGSAVRDILTKSAEDNSGKFICVVEGAIPGPFEGKDTDGCYGTVGGETMLSIARKICPKAKWIIAIGNCASFGGIPCAKPNYTQAKNVIAAFAKVNEFDKLPQVINVPGCPPNPVAFVGTIAYLLLNNTPPPTDAYLRPKFAYWKTVHERCPNLPYQDDQSETSPCHKWHGCKGPSAGNICPTAKFNNGANFPTIAGHVCIACSEPNFWDEKTPFWKILDRDTPFKIKPKDIFEKDPPPPAVPEPPNAVMPYSKTATMRVTTEKTEIKTFNALGRRMRSPIKNRKIRKQPIAPGMYFEKIKEKSRKAIKI